MTTIRLRDVTKWRLPNWVPRGARLRLFVVWDSLQLTTYRATTDRWLPAYVGPVSYEGHWLRDWRGATGAEVGVAGRHAVVSWGRPGPDSWFWRRLPR